VSSKYCIIMTVVSTKDGTKCVETIDDSRPERPSSENHAYDILAVEGHKRVRWFPLQVLQRNLDLHLIRLGFSIIWIPPAWLSVVGDKPSTWIAEVDGESPTWLGDVGDGSTVWLVMTTLVPPVSTP
jgi:hypothetical protein